MAVMVRYYGSESTAGEVCTTPTYDGSGQCVHPDVLDFGLGGWQGWRYWMAMTPYPLGNSVYENPSILVSDDGVTWQVPDGLTNPIDPKPTMFNSDTELTLVEDTLYCTYRDQGVGVWLRTSPDGITWSDEVYTNLAVWAASLTIVWVVDRWVGWFSSGGGTLQRKTTTDFINWTATQNCTVSPVPDGKKLWHHDVILDGDQYVGVFTFCDIDTNGANGVNYWATSNDGLAWTVSASPIISVPSTGWDNGQHYRATLTPAKYGETGSGVYNIWYSAANASNVWHVGLLRSMRLRLT